MPVGASHRQTRAREPSAHAGFFFFLSFHVSCRRKGSFFVSQVVLTPKASTVMKGVASGLRETITERFVLLAGVRGRRRARSWREESQL